MEPNLIELNQKQRQLWNRNAKFWDETIAEGNHFQLKLVIPTIESLLGQEIKRAKILDVACGNGALSRRLAKQGAMVTACDFSEELLTFAKLREVENSFVDYRKIDFTSTQEIMAIESNYYDVIICNMAIMDIVDIRPLISSIPRLLKGNGKFIFTILHPIFSSAGSKVSREIWQNGVPSNAYSIEISNYLVSDTKSIYGVRNQPVPTLLFHRTISEILSICFSCSLLMDGCEEVGYTENNSNTNGELSWKNFIGLPAVFAARFCLCPGN